MSIEDFPPIDHRDENAAELHLKIRELEKKYSIPFIACFYAHFALSLLIFQDTLRTMQLGISGFLSKLQSQKPFNSCKCEVGVRCVLALHLLSA